MKKSLQIASVAMLALAFSGTAVAKTVTPEEALARAISQPSGSKMKKPVNMQAAKLEYKSVSASVEKTPMVYVFSKGAGNGFLVTPADDQFPAILGYSDKGTFSSDNMAPAMKWWLDEYAREMDYMLANNKKALLKARRYKSEEEKPSIDPLVKSHWDQTAPYNRFSPTFTVNGRTYESLTGCVAVSMSQVMNYHKWPVTGEGSISYEWQPYTNVEKRTLSMDFSKVTFDWDNMLDDYNGKYTEEQGNAVALLQQAAGYSLQMHYSDEASGAYSSEIANVLPRYFGYSKDIRYQQRDYCSSSEWEDIIYENLKNEMPVVLSGQGTGGGHSFVCDGYSHDHYFHINWGWSGMSDGYFLLCRLNPDDLGAGGGAGGFNYSQGVVYNIKPVRDGDPEGTPAPAVMTCYGDLYFGTSGNSQGLMVSYDGEQSGFYNLTETVFEGAIGIIFENANTGDVLEAYLPDVVLEPYYGYSFYIVFPDDIPDGIYNIYPSYRYKGEEKGHKMPVPNGCQGSLVFAINGDNVDVYDPETHSPDIVTLAFNYRGKVYSDEMHNYTMSFANLSKDMDYYGELTLNVRKKGGAEVLGDISFDFDIPSDLSLPYSMGLSIPFEPGEYEVYFTDRNGNVLPGVFPLVISEGASEALTTSYKVVSVTPVDFAPKSVNKISLTVNWDGTDNNYNLFVLEFYDENGNRLIQHMDNWILNPWPATGRNLYYDMEDVEIDLEPGNYILKVLRAGVEIVDGKQSIVSVDVVSAPVDITVGHPVESVALNKNFHEMNIGETHNLNAEIMPEHATFKTLNWMTTDPSVVTVDNNGMIEGKSEGSANVVATSPNGMFDVCEVAVGTETSVEDIFGEVSEVIAVYSVSGVKILDRPSAEEVKALEKGVYVVVTDKGSYKLAR